MAFGCRCVSSEGHAGPPLVSQCQVCCQWDLAPMHRLGYPPATARRHHAYRRTGCEAKHGMGWGACFLRSMPHCLLRFVAEFAVSGTLCPCPAPHAQTTHAATLGTGELLEVVQPYSTEVLCESCMAHLAATLPDTSN